MSFKAEVIADSSGTWASNALRFATEAEAQQYVGDLASRWTAVRETRVVESEDMVAARIVADRLQHWRSETRCNKCHRPMHGSTPSDGACECGGLIEETGWV